MKPYKPMAGLSGAEHSGIVRDVFSSIHDEYDFLNRFLSLRRDVYWRKRASESAGDIGQNRCLDLATGTADLALDLAAGNPRASVVAADLSVEMLDRARAKVNRLGLENRISLAACDAQNLPFPPSCFDAATIAFGIRNIPDRACALREIRRVLRAGGRIIVLEMGLPGNRALRKVYRTYLVRILPALARPFTRNTAAYRYLADSTVNFPEPAAFCGELVDAGFTGIKTVPLTFGAVNLYTGHKGESNSG
ncbi:MAG: ubiquinone/menaquinone biosynthesis methyltransferase [Syntrophales bacterium]|nr:ubiquinone/menaquinone biosynthesis methyltransferase [Syntrophales bacterium]MDD5531733.1 ubiquinone/menaquinone biosynthesis methyltransferase [Syntrophales bacterium]HPL64656.1 ubiquinone/menaquinone biosynthesis methyltransferase [Syntrophales bacterium]